ncbi:hypothetical protein DBR06_SOUSAS12610023, partial [Sousa chinensis]
PDARLTVKKVLLAALKKTLKNIT